MKDLEHTILKEKLVDELISGKNMKCFDQLDMEYTPTIGWGSSRAEFVGSMVSGYPVIMIQYCYALNPETIRLTNNVKNNKKSILVLYNSAIIISKEIHEAHTTHRFGGGGVYPEKTYISIEKKKYHMPQATYLFSNTKIAVLTDEKLSMINKYVK